MIDSIAGTRRVVIAGREATEIAFDRLSVVVEGGPDKGKSATLRSTGLRIGTDPDNDLVLSDSSVSRRHVALALTSGGVSVQDLVSTNGTWLDGVRVSSAVAAHRAALRIGSTVLRLLVSANQFLVFPDEATTLGAIVGRSQAMRNVFALVRQLAKTDLPVAITGETGTGKELVARALHDWGPRRDKPFRILDCGAIVPELLRSELFGHEKGAFTGAAARQKGVLEEASEGTVFLDEIGELEPCVQPNLLRALESREVWRIGARQAVPVDVRIVSATNRDLRKEVQTGRFRADLLYRLSCVTVRLPPLRERVEDIELLVTRFLEACAQRHRIAVPLVTKPALESLARHPWPGNVRELKNACEALCVLSNGGPILPDAVETAVAASGPEPVLSRGGSLEAVERAAIEEALRATGWNRSATARRLEISPTTLYAKIQKFGLKPPGDRQE